MRLVFLGSPADPPLTMPALEIPYTHVDAFATTAFAGNPAAVVLLDETTDAALTDTTRNLLAREFNLPMTAFVVRTPGTQTSGSVLGPFGIRWITATGSEVKLCGHGTVAAAHTLFEQHVEPGKEVAVRFETRFSGELTVSRGKDGKIGLTFPAGELEPASEELLQKFKAVLQKAFPKQAGIGDAVRKVNIGVGATFRTYSVIEVDSSVDIASLEANPKALLELAPLSNISITNTGPLALQSAGVHFVSRVWIPLHGIDEDAVCGSAHCLLTPYWTRRLEAQGEGLLAKQVSERGGDLDVEFVASEKVVKLAGPAVIVAKGTAFVTV